MILLNEGIFGPCRRGNINDFSKDDLSRIQIRIIFAFTPSLMSLWTVNLRRKATVVLLLKSLPWAQVFVFVFVRLSRYVTTTRSSCCYFHFSFSSLASQVLYSSILSHQSVLHQRFSINRIS